MAEQPRGSDGGCECHEVGHHVIDRRDELLVGDMGDGDEETARKGDGEEQSDHNAQSRGPLAVTRSFPLLEHRSSTDTRTGTL